MNAPGARDCITAFEEDLCLAFANTRYWRGSAAPTESLVDPAALFGWCERRAGVARTLVRALARDADAAALMTQALALREAIYRLFAATALNQALPGGDLTRLGAALAAAPAREALVRDGSVLAWRVKARPGRVEVLLAPVIWSAADLLTRASMRRIRCCGNPQCLWLFIDRSKSGTRRWCDMGACGNRAKAARHYSRTKQARTAGQSPMGGPSQCK
jgi:predicted RNA-binding Zn ribbon-like protein